MKCSLVSKIFLYFIHNFRNDPDTAEIMYVIIHTDNKHAPNNNNYSFVYFLLLLKLFKRNVSVLLLIVIYEPSARKHFSHMSALFEAQATKERVLHLRECPEYVFAHRGLYNIF
jgi:hypothetical protein